MATVNAFIRTSKKDKEVNIRFRLRDGRLIQLFHSSELKILPELWDSKTQSIKSRVIYDSHRRKELNLSILKRKELIAQIYDNIDCKESLNSTQLDLLIDQSLFPNKYNLKETPNTLFTFIERFIEEAPDRRDRITGRCLSPNNIQQYKATFQHLKDFAYKKRCKDFDFNDINNDFYNDFVLYLQEEQKDINDDNKLFVVKKEFTQNTVGKHIRILKLMLNEATSMGVNDITVYNSFHVFTEDVDSIYLNETELQSLFDYDFNNQYFLDRVRDWFLLLAWTGSRFSDLSKIKTTDIKDDFISFRQQKTNNKVVIPLHPIVKSILEKYKFKMPDPISNQKFNEYIKEVARLAGIDKIESLTRTEGGNLVTYKEPKWKLVSSHTGRRSFCTNMFKRGIPTLTIMSISGHKTEKAFLRYIKVTQAEHAELLKAAWDKTELL